MANQGAPSATITWMSNDITEFIETISEVVINNELDEITSVAGANPKIVSVGFQSGADITVTGPWDDSGTAAGGGSVANFGPSVTSDTLAIGYGGGKSTSSTFFVKSFGRTITKKKETRFKAVLTQSGAITEA